MSETDAVLGLKIHRALSQAGIESAILTVPKNERYLGAGVVDVDKLVPLFDELLTKMNLDLQDESIKDTPRRLAKMYINELFRGMRYENFPKCTTSPQDGVQYNQMVVCKGASVKSVCEHHWMPFVGKAWIAYIPEKTVLGLSKMNRLTDFFSRRPQVQERLTEQIHLAMQEITGSRHIAVAIEAEHFCVSHRGVQDHGALTRTVKLSGDFMGDSATRAEFMACVGDHG